MSANAFKTALAIALAVEESLKLLPERYTDADFCRVLNHAITVLERQRPDAYDALVSPLLDDAIAIINEQLARVPSTFGK